MPPSKPRGWELHVTRMLLVMAIALAQANWISVHAADVSAEAKTAVEKGIAELGCSKDVNDDIEAHGDGYKAEYVLCADGPYYLTFDKDCKLTGKEKQDRVEGPVLQRNDREATASQRIAHRLVCV